MSNTREPAHSLPVARVLPLLGIAHLDRLFDYLVDTEQDEDVAPGIRVRVKFAGRTVDAIVFERTSVSEHEGDLRYIERVVSSEVVMPPFSRKLIESLATRYAGVTSDVIRLAIPPRHAKAEESDTSTPWEELGTATEPDLSIWSGYVHGQSFVDAVIGGSTARGVWQVAPGDRWDEGVAGLAAKVAIDGGGVIIVVPDQRDVDTLIEALARNLGKKQITELSAGLGPQARYRRFLSVLHGQGRVVVGTRSAAFAPVENLRLCVIKDDGDENLVEQRAPYVHAREVLSTRCVQQKSSFLIASSSRTAEAQLLVDSGWAHDLVAPREAIRKRMPYIHAAADSDFALERDPAARFARMPGAAFHALRAAIGRGDPVIVQVPRKGYVPTLSCGNCRAPSRCRYCNGPLGIPTTHGGSDAGVPTCGWCGRSDSHHRCGNCGSTKVRAVVVGQERTAEEIGRAFPQIPVVTSGGNRVVDEVAASSQIVVATPGAEPRVVDGAYGAAVIVDTWSMLGRQDLRATEDAFAKWIHLASLVAPGSKGGEVVVVADPGLGVVQSLIRWDVVGAARAELDARKDVHFPPAVNIAAIDGANSSIESYLESIELPPHAEVLGPVDLPPGVKLPGEYDEKSFGPAQRVLLRTPLGPRSQLGAILKKGLVARAARKDTLPLRVQMDPIRIG